MTDSINNRMDIIDSREIIDRLSELTTWAGDDMADESELDELRALNALEREALDYTDEWADGVQLVRDSYFTEHAQELAEDCFGYSATVEWPHRHIDWEAAADELKQDYTMVEFDGVNYWMRG